MTMDHNEKQFKGVYLGDGAYVKYSGDDLVLFTHNGVHSTNSVYLERSAAEVWQKLDFMEDRAIAAEKALADLHRLRPAAEWHDDIGTVLWWHLPIQEPPYVGCGEGADERDRFGKPTPCARALSAGWLTHWSPLPRNPEVAK